MESPVAYIPIDRRLAIARGEDLPDRTQGAALFADISGFTPLTEALVRTLGRQRGAEELPSHLNRVYDALIAQVDRYGGSVLGFSGDAITCWLDGDDGLRATACALAMQQAMQQFASVALPDGSTVALAIKVAVATGPARRFLVGDSDVQLIDVLAGAILERLAAAEHEANKGEVILDSHASAELRDHVTVAEWRTDEKTGERFAVVTGLANEVTPAPWPPLDPQALSDEQICPWLLPPVYQHLRSGLGEFLTELRPAVSLFLRFGGIDYDGDVDAGAKLDAYIRWVQHTLTRYGAFMLQLTIGDKGSYLYAAFGAPLAHEDDAIRAAAAALELRLPPPELAFIQNVQIGISQGRMRTGAYGGETRRTYGVLGDHVNLAARLMQNAQPGQVLVSHAAQKHAANAFTWESLPPLRVKGKSELVTVFRVIAAKDRQALRLQEPRYALPMVGRKDELALAEQKLAQVINAQGQIIAVTAEAGMGKSRLVAEIIRMASERQLTGYAGECQSYGTHNSYLVWESIWQTFFGVDVAGPLDEQVQILETQLSAIDPMLVSRLPLLGMVLNLPIPDNDLTRSLDAKLRKDSLEALLVDCLRARARSTPTLLVLEDCHWIDPLSHDLLEAIGRAIADLPVLIIIAYRPPELEHLQAPRVTLLAHCTVVRLTDFTPEEAEQLITLKLAQLGGSGAELPAVLVERITARAQGNPFYIEELLNYLRDQGLDMRDLQAMEQLELPTSLHKLILSRIDQLSEHQKITVKVASIIGRLFQFRWLWGVHPQLGEVPRVKADLDALSRLDLTPLDQPEPELTYLFKHIVTREVAYESLPFATRELLHGQLGLFIEQTYQDSLDQHLDLLAHHYWHSRNDAKKREYLRRAGEAAQAAYANSTAIDYFKRLLPLLHEDEVRQQINARLGEVLAVTAQYDAALDHLREALNLAAKRADHESEAKVCRWISYVYELQSEFLVALEWIQHGLDALGDQQTATTAELLAIAGLISTRQGNYDQAAEQCDHSIAIARQLGAIGPLAFAHNARGTVFRCYGNYTTAIDYFQKAAELYERSENIHGQAMSYYGISNTYENLACWPEAYDNAQRAREIFVRTGDELHRAFADNALGEIARNQGRLDDALVFYQEALSSFEQLGDLPYLAGIMHINLGATFIRRGQKADARHELALAEACLKHTQSRDVLPALHMYLAEAALLAGELVEAATNGQQALKLALDLEMNGEEGMIRRVLGEIAAARGDVAQSETYLNTSIAILHEVEQEYEAARSRLALATVYHTCGRVDESLAQLDQCTPVFERLEAVLDLKAAQDLREKLEQNA